MFLLIGFVEIKSKPAEAFSKDSEKHFQNGWKQNPSGRKQIPNQFLSSFNRLPRKTADAGLEPLRPPRSRGGASCLSRLLIFAKQLSTLIALPVGWGLCRSRLELQPSWPGLSRPSTPRRAIDGSDTSMADGKGLKTQSFSLLPLACERLTRRTTWMAGTSPAMTPSGPPAGLPLFRFPCKQQLTR